MKLSLQQLKAEKLFKDEFKQSTAIVRRPSLEERENYGSESMVLPKVIIERDGQCLKHGRLHLECARLGAKRTKAKRWRNNGDRVFGGSGSFISDRELDRIEELYRKAKDNFHQATCSCPLASILPS